MDVGGEAFEKAIARELMGIKEAAAASCYKTQPRAAEGRVKLRGCLIALVMLYPLASFVMAQSNLNPASNEQYQARLGRYHESGAAAAHEAVVRRQGPELGFARKGGLAEAATLYRGIPR